MNENNRRVSYQYYINNGKEIFTTSDKVKKPTLKKFIEDNLHGLNVDYKRNHIVYNGQAYGLLNIGPDFKNDSHDTKEVREKKLNSFKVDKERIKFDFDKFIVTYYTIDKYISFIIDGQIIKDDFRREPNYFTKLDNIFNIYNKIKNEVEFSTHRPYSNDSRKDNFKLKAYINSEIKKIL